MASSTTSLRDRLRQRERLVGCFQQIAAPEATEAAAFAGFDFVVIDLEHGLIGEELLGTLIRAAQSTDIAPLVRIPDGDAPRIGRILDAGAAGIVAPHLRSPAEARGVVAATRYPPRGERGAAGSRLTGFGRKTGMAELAEGACDAALVAMVEDQVGLAQADEIAAVDGVDALLIGTTDMSMDLGVPGRRDDPQVTDAVDAVCEIARQHGISAGVPVGNAAEANDAFARGATFVATGDAHALTGALERFRAGISEPELS